MSSKCLKFRYVAWWGAKARSFGWVWFSMSSNKGFIKLWGKSWVVLACWSLMVNIRFPIELPDLWSDCRGVEAEEGNSIVNEFISNRPVCSAKDLGEKRAESLPATLNLVWNFEGIFFLVIPKWHFTWTAKIFWSGWLWYRPIYKFSRLVDNEVTCWWSSLVSNHGKFPNLYFHMRMAQRNLFNAHWLHNNITPLFISKFKMP